MLPFRIHTGLVAPLDRPNIDTDQIIPKQFLKRIERTGFGEFLFYDWRYTAENEIDASFVLNEAKYAGASILVAGRNFGCGSSREHAPWALLDYGFRAVIASSFADIFANNCMKNGILPIVLSEKEVCELADKARILEDYRLTIDLEKKVIADGRGFSAAFEIDDFRRYCLMEGLDDIALSLQYEPQVTAYEARRAKWRVSLGQS
jgi:3-isopropylmalate/(R)-2-methylmalate dehydratase small subunit